MPPHRIAAAVVVALLTLVVGCAGTDDGGATASPEADPAVSEPADGAAATEMDDMADMSSPDDEGSEQAADATAGADHGEFTFGAPAEPEEADRTVEVATVEEGGFAYEPPRIEVAAGETVTFEVTNVGEAVHEFVLGDEATQQAHEAEMQEMEEGMVHDEPNAISLQPGETKSLTWTFDEPGEFLYGCHEPGHYDAGMVGEIDVA